MKLAFLNYALKTEEKITINTRWCHYLDCAKASSLYQSSLLHHQCKTRRQLKKKKR